MSPPARTDELKIDRRIEGRAIFSSNVDEFFIVRVAGLRQQVETELFFVLNPGI